ALLLGARGGLADRKLHRRLDEAGGRLHRVAVVQRADIRDVVRREERPVALPPAQQLVRPGLGESGAGADLRGRGIANQRDAGIVELPADRGNPVRAGPSGVDGRPARRRVAQVRVDVERQRDDLVPRVRLKVRDDEGDLVGLGHYSVAPLAPPVAWAARPRSEEHTSELQSRENLVCRLLLEKKKQIYRVKFACFVQLKHLRLRLMYTHLGYGDMTVVIHKSVLFAPC